MSMTCFEWVADGKVEINRLTPEEYKTRDTSFKRDLNLRFGSEKVPKV